MPTVMSRAGVQDRLRRRFQRWDVDNSGSLERSDFEREASAIARQLGESPTSPKVKRLTQALVGMFEAIARDAGSSPAGTISWEQFRQVADQWMGESEENLRQQMRPMVEAVVSIADTSGNGTIERAEFTKWISAIGVDRSQAERTFDQIDTDGSGELSVDEVLQACVDFHLGKSEFEIL
jgi:Ca2+-binding EF-hand superfamily protein